MKNTLRNSALGLGLLIALLSLGGLLQSQTGLSLPVAILYSNGNASGACTSGQIDVDYSTPALYICKSSTWSLVVGGSSGATNTDFALVRTSSTVATINSAATTGAPVNGRVGSQPYSFTAPATVTLSGTACTATQFWYIDGSSGALTMGHNASSCTYTGSGVTVATPIAAYPATAIPLWTTSTTSGAWDTITGAMDKRALNSVGRLLTGTGCISLTTSATSTAIDGSACGTPFPNTSVYASFIFGSGFAGGSIYGYNGGCTGNARTAPSATYPYTILVWASSGGCGVFWPAEGDNDTGVGVLSGATPTTWTLEIVCGRANSTSDVYCGWNADANGTVTVDNSFGVRLNSSGTPAWQVYIRSGGSDSGTPQTLTTTIDTANHTFLCIGSGVANAFSCNMDGGAQVPMVGGTIPAVNAYHAVIAAPTTGTNVSTGRMQIKIP